jgi:chromosome segregation ATPase
VPRIEEVQFVNWGSLRPDPVPLLTNGVNVATGPNGSGKTCFLDAIKLLLGITGFAPGRTSARYIFDGGPSGAPADRAWLRATFANPAPVPGGERLFAPAGAGCGEAEQVSVVCLVTADERRYRVLPGLVRWGRPIESGLRDFVDANPLEEWLEPRPYDELLERTGVTQALRAVLALPQGAIDRVVEERPAGMLRRLLELAGERDTYQTLHAARDRWEGARAAYLAAMEQYKAELDRLAALERQAARHREWAGLRDQLDHLRLVARPAAEYRDLAEEVEAERAHQDRIDRSVAGDRAALAALAEEVPRLQATVQGLEDQAQEAEHQLDEAEAALRDLDLQVAAVQARQSDAQAAVARTRSLAGARSQPQALRDAAAAEAALATALAEREAVASALARREAEVGALRSGRLPAPPEVEAFRDRLRAEGIEATMVAEVLDLNDGGADEASRVRAEAALGEALWGLMVPSDAYREATTLAVETGYRGGVVRAGAGEPTGALAEVVAPGELGLLLERADAWSAHDAKQAHGLASRGHAAVAPDGMRYGDSLARRQAPDLPVLGRLARERRLSAARAEVIRLTEELEELDARVPKLRAAWHRASWVLEAVRAVPADLQPGDGTAPALEEARALRPSLAARPVRLRRQLREVAEQLGAAGAELALARERQAKLEARLTRTLPRLTEQEHRAARLEAELAERSLTSEQRLVVESGALPGTESLLHDIDWLAAQVADDRFGPDARDDGVLAQRDAQSRAVREADRVAGERRLDMEALEAGLEDSRSRYEERVRRVVRGLSEEFARVCRIAGTDGELRLVTGDRPEEYGVDVLVAHRTGERRRSYRDAAHSGGQRAKIAILLLLATMGSAGRADLLLMDEHIAHLDSTNIDHLAELMRALNERVQFVLATPTNAEALRLSWCDLQLAFLPRDPGQPYNPPIRILSRLGAGDLAARYPREPVT